MTEEQKQTARAIFEDSARKLGFKLIDVQVISPLPNVVRCIGLTADPNVVIGPVSYNIAALDRMRGQ